MNRRRKSCYRPYEGKRWPLWRKAVLALLLAGALAFGALFGAVMYGAYDHIQGEPRLMVILGCQVKPWGPSILLQDRLDKALDYLEEHPDVQVVVSGGQGPDEPTTEAQAMYDYLVEYGVEPERIWQEDQSHNTWQNVRYTLALLEEKGRTRVPAWCWCPAASTSPGRVCCGSAPPAERESCPPWRPPAPMCRPG